MARPTQPVDPQKSLRHLVGATIRHWREVNGMSVIDLARELCIDPSHLSKWERGLAPVPADQISRIDTVLNAGRHITAVHATTTELEEHRTRNRATVEAANPHETDDRDMKRRAALQLLAALAAGAAVPPGVLEEILSGITPTFDDHADLQEWERTVQEYSHLINVRPIGALIPDLTADIITVSRLLDRRHAPLTHAGLLRVGAGLSGILATQLDDVGDRRAARVAWSVARRAADASGDRNLSVWARGYEADEATWAGRAVHVVSDLADEAIRSAGGVPSNGLGRAYAARARLAARDGDKATALAALDGMANVTEHGLKDFPERLLWWNRAYIYTLVGDPRAEQALDQAFALYPPDTLGPVSNLRLIQAVALVRQREVEEGIRHAITALEEGPISTTRRHLTGQIVKALPDRAQALPDARELRTLASGA